MEDAESVDSNGMWNVCTLFPSEYVGYKLLSTFWTLTLPFAFPDPIQSRTIMALHRFALSSTHYTSTSILYVLCTYLYTSYELHPHKHNAGVQPGYTAQPSISIIEGIH